MSGLAQDIIAVIALATSICTVYLWVTRQIIRSEIARAMQHEMKSVKQDVEVLRTAVFNHLSHDDTPVEANIREVLGYGSRQ